MALQPVICRIDIAFEEFVTGNGSDTDGTDFVVTLENSTSGFENSFGVFVFNEETGEASDVQIVAANAQNGGSITVEDVAEGEQLGFFIVQDGADAVSQLGSVVDALFRERGGAGHAAGRRRLPEKGCALRRLVLRDAACLRNGRARDGDHLRQ